MPFMDTIIEIDKAGRVVVPKQIRDTLHLIPGTKLNIRIEGNEIILKHEAKPRGLYRKRGVLVYDSGLPVPAEVVDWLKEDREERMDKVSGTRKAR
jgi:AbrB family looped-hinge helix DNA binding protein